MLKKVIDVIKKMNYTINNIDINVIAQRPKISSHRKKIIKSIDKIKPVNGRLEKVGNIKNNSKVILDYAHTPDALKTCLTNLREQFKLSKVSIVFGCGGERDKPKRILIVVLSLLFGLLSHTPQLSS
mgnify:CR=1 FL=1